MQIRKTTNAKNRDTIRIAELADALSHPVRITLLKYVHSQTKTGTELRNDVCNRDLVNYLGFAQATVSQHVKKLIEVGILIKTPVDKFSYYRINYEVLKQYVNQIQTTFSL